MEDIKAIRKLIYSLQIVGNFVDKVDVINSSDEFLEIHNRNINSLKVLSKTRNANYFNEKVQEYPKLDKTELDEYIKEKKGSTNIIFAIGGWFLALISLILKTVKTKGNNLGGTKNKLNDIKRINNSIIYVIENPGFDELISSKNKINI